MRRRMRRRKSNSFLTRISELTIICEKEMEERRGRRRRRG